ncbi:ABC transporter permease [Bacillus luti]|nr:ABC transporter permease [Bacillus cereus]HDR8328213.1 ABC transporter permease [Bacillus cereus]HDR8336003.1 ABC transporter permease [Bacillus cereus]
MSLSQLALRNVKRNFKNYFLYFFSMIFSIVIYYTFKSIEFNSQIEKAMEGSNKISTAFTTSSVLLILFVGIFIIYSNSFFTKKRKKEVGLYSLLGVRKKQIAKMLFYENMTMGLIALVLGIAIGSLFSTLSTELLLNLMGIPMDIHFEIPMNAVINTSIVFSVIILYTSLQGFRLIYRFKLIELFRAEKQGEKVPKNSPILAILGLSMVILGYYFAYNFIDYVEKINFLMLALLILISTAGGTYILFHFFTVFLLRHMRNNKNSFYNGMNVISTSQLLYRIKGNATSLATISTLAAVTICSIGISVSLYSNIEDMTKGVYPYSYTHTVIDANKEAQVDATIEKHKSKHQISHDYLLKTLEVKGTAHENTIKINKTELNENTTITVISQSTFKDFAKEFNYNNVKLNKEETVALTSELSIKIKKQFGDLQESNKTKVTMSDGQNLYTYKIKEELPYPTKNLFSDTFIVSDEQYEHLKTTSKEEITRIINVENESDSKSLTADLKTIIDNKEMPLYDYYTPYQQGIEGSGMMIFVGAFLGLVFLLATGSIIYFKQLSEANEDKPNYAILHKVGVTNKEMKRAISKQMAFIFGAPILIAALHSFFALNTAKTIFMLTDITPILYSVLGYLVIYIGYFIITIYSYTNIVRKKD